ncbi:GEVED domain-containing protein [Chryseobacterium sp. KACC 21268]|nr:GEVED domain-containing protein [Chryseobacterium sp. KACC 21268]
MKKNLLASFIVLGVGMSAQVTGSKTIGMDYPNLNSAFADLNTNGLGSGGVTLNIPAGYTETSPAGGYMLGSTVLNASLSSENPLLIQKSGSGLNPLFTGSTGTSTTVDAIFKFSGVDYMTIDGIDLRESADNTNATTLNERGFAFYNLSNTDGCSYNTIKNSTVTFLKTVNNTATGIIFIHSTATGTLVFPSATTGSHSFNKIYSNTIVKALGSAISFTGYAAPSPYTLYDQGNDVGGSTSETGNTLTDIGGMAGGEFITNNYGLSNTYQNNANISNNKINFSPDGKGTIGIYAFGASCTYTINNNTVNASGKIDSSAGTSHIGIYGSSSGLNLTANNNVVNVLAAPFSGRTATYGLWSQNAGGNLSFDGNTVMAKGDDTVYGIYANATGASVNVTNNTVKNITSTGAFGNTSAIYMNATGIATNISGNKISNLTANGLLGSAYGLYVGGSTASTTTNVFNNLIGDLKTPTVNDAAARLVGIYLAATGATSKLNIYYNTVNLNGTSNGTNFSSSGIYHTFNTNATTAALDLRNNVIVNNSMPNGSGTASAFRRNSATNLNNYATTSDNNDFAVGPAGFIFFDGTTKYNLADFKSLASPRDDNSLSVIPQFTSPVGTDADYLKLNSYAPVNEQLDNRGVDMMGFATDFAGVTRNSVTPDLGAYEFSFAVPTVAPNCTTVYAPVNASTGNIPNQITISWLPTEYATGYKLYLGTTPGGAELIDGMVFTTLLYPTTLEKNKTYYVKVVPTNNIGDASGCSETTFSTTEFSFCPITYPNVEPISNVTFAGINNSSSSDVTGNTGYQDFTNVVGQVYTNLSSTLTIAGNTNGNRTSYYAVFIDWNQNGSLNDAGEVYFGDGSLFITNSTGADEKIATANIAVPSNAKLGLTRMRIKKEYSAAVPSSTGNFANPCDKVQSFGQVEDYTLNVSDSTLALSDVNKTKISVYPNPFTDVLRISDVKDVKSISISDMTGRQVRSLNPSSALKLGNLNAGLYIVNLQMEDGSSKSFKIIKK